ncbi:MAG: sulfatase [bacterium]
MQKKPNVLLILMDSVRSANLSCYGYHRNTTPNLDKFATQGVLFEQAISESCWTLPAHTSVFTGLYPVNHDVTISKDALPKNHPTLAGILKDEGYQTCCFSNNAYISPATGLTRGFGHVEDIWRITHPRGIKRTLMSRINIQLRKLGKLGAPLLAFTRLLRHLKKMVKEQKNTQDSGAEFTNQRIKKWLSESWDKEKPFFMYVNYMECHEKYYPPHPHDRKFMPSRYSGWRVLRVNPEKSKILNASKKRRKEDIEILTALYDGELNYLDQKIGELLEFLKSCGLTEDTVTVITSDHGDSLGEHDELGHRTALYEQLIRVPLIIRYNDTFEPGGRMSKQVQLSDLYPTLLELAGADSAKLKHKGFVSLCDLEKVRNRKFTISENTAPKSMDSMTSRTIRMERYKFIWNSNGEHELYDLQEDPDELENIINSKPVVASQLQEQLQEWQQKNKDFKIGKGQSVFDEEVSERLRALGYIN